MYNIIKIKREKSSEWQSLTTHRKRETIMKYTQEQINEIVRKEEERKERQRKQTRRQLAKMKILTRKAKDAGIIVTEAEIEAELNK